MSDPAPSPAIVSPSTAHATLGGGCFWCTEAVFERLPGVRSVLSGYAGGARPNPTYEQICSGATGHAEVIRVEFDPSEISFSELLDVFWLTHDPTTLNRQGNDTGTQYRSVIFWHDEEQRAVAEASRAAAQAGYPNPIVTEISPLPAFYEAEPYHQDFYRLNPRQSYCAYVIPPKLKKLEKHLAERSA